MDIVLRRKTLFKSEETRIEEATDEQIELFALRLGESIGAKVQNNIHCSGLGAKIQMQININLGGGTPSIRAITD